MTEQKEAILILSRGAKKDDSAPAFDSYAF